jgi:predicted ATP-grasp superfamily ATP-dependent carboligase
MIHTPPSRELPPALILDGGANALSVARDLGRMGVSVHAIGPRDSVVKHSRYCNWIALEESEEAWVDFLLGPDAGHLQGTVLLACGDAALAVLIRHRDALLRRFRLDLCNPAAQRAMLDKLTTYHHARAAGVPAPGFWEIASRDQVIALRDALVFPLLVKPHLSHVFESRFGRKHVLVHTFDELLTAIDAATRARTDVLLMEHIPGADDLLCSYYTYLDEQGEPQFHFTKRIIRRYPAGMGTACYHVTDWIPDIVPPALKLFEQAGLRGLANVEFKRDPRDGQYKLIECNARFTASNCLVSASGFSLARFVYNRLTGRPQPPLTDYKFGLRLWDPARDWCAYRELRRAGKLSLWRWLTSIAHRRQTFAYFRWTDPMPAVARAFKPVGKLLGKAASPFRRARAPLTAEGGAA